MAEFTGDRQEHLVVITSKSFVRMIFFDECFPSSFNADSLSLVLPFIPSNSLSRTICSPAYISFTFPLICRNWPALYSLGRNESTIESDREMMRLKLQPQLQLSLTFRPPSIVLPTANVISLHRRAIKRQMDCARTNSLFFSRYQWNLSPIFSEIYSQYSSLVHFFTPRQCCTLFHS